MGGKVEVSSPEDTRLRRGAAHEKNQETNGHSLTGGPAYGWVCQDRCTYQDMGNRTDAAGAPTLGVG